MNKLFEYSPTHFRFWADTIERRQGYKSALSEFLEKLADALEAGEIKWSLGEEENEG